MSVVVRDFPRADRALVEGLAALGVSTVHEADRRRGALATAVRPIQDGARIGGTAVTVSCPPGDNLMIHAAIETCRPGDVVVTLSDASLPADAPRQEYNWWVGAYQNGGQRVPLTSGDFSLAVTRLKGGTPSPPKPGLTAANAVFGAIRPDRPVTHACRRTMTGSRFRAVASFCPG